MLSLFRSKHRARLADLTTQIADCERDLQDAETRARDAVVNGHGLAELTNEVVRLSAELSAFGSARQLVASELTDLRAAAAEAALTAKLDSAQERVAEWSGVPST